MSVWNANAGGERWGINEWWGVWLSADCSRWSASFSEHYRADRSENVIATAVRRRVCRMLSSAVHDACSFLCCCLQTAFFFCSACWSHNPAGGSLRAWRQTAKNKNLLHIFTPAVRAHADNMLQLQVALECFKTKRVSSCDSPLSSPPLSFTFQGAQITSSSATVRLMESRSCDLRQSVSPLTSRFFFYLSSRRLPPPALCWTLSAELTERHVGSAAEKLKCNFKGVFDVFFFFPALHLTSCFLLAPASLQLWAVFLSLLLFVRVFREVCLLLWRV